MLVRRRGLGEVLSYDPMAGQDPAAIKVELSVRSIFDQAQASASGNVAWLAKYVTDQTRQLVNSGAFSQVGVTSFDDPRVQAILEKYVGARMQAAVTAAQADAAVRQAEFQAAEVAAGWSPVAPPSSQPSFNTVIPSGGSFAQLNPDVSMPSPQVPGGAGGGGVGGPESGLPPTTMKLPLVGIAGLAALAFVLFRRRR